MKRATFLIDGFNLYHSVRKAQNELKVSTKWLDIKSLLKSYIYLLGQDAYLHEIYYFSALAKHLEAKNPEVTKRHNDLIKCLKATGVHVELNRFKKKSIRCNLCKKQFTKHEEKETDVSIAVKLLELLISNSCEIAMILTGDTDISPAVKTAKMLYPDKKIGFAFPYKRKNNELIKLADFHFEINKRQYAKHQFCDPFTTQQGIIKKPCSW